MRLYISLLAAVGLTVSAAAQINARPSQMVDTTTTGFGLLPSVASDGDLMVVAYNDGGSGGSNVVYVVTSDGRGETWSAPVTVAPAGAAKITQFDSCRVFGSNVYVVWREVNGGVGFARSTDSGANFSGSIPSPSGTVRDYAFAASSLLDLYVLATVDPTGSADEELYLMSSHDGGVNWSNPLRVNSTNDDVDDIALAADAQNPLTVHIVWQDDRAGSSSMDDIFYRRSADGGATFTGMEVQLDSSGPLNGDADFELSVKADGPIVGVLWQEELGSTNEEVRFTSSIDGGVTFATDQKLGSYTSITHDIDFAGFGMFGATFYAAWDDNRTGSDLLYVTSSPDFGTTWRPDTVLSGPDGSAARFAGSATGDIVGVAFTADTGSPDGAQSAFTEDGGLTWTVAQDISDQPNNDIDFVELGYNDLYRNFVSAWLANTGSAGSATANRIYVGGYRPQTVRPIGWDDPYNPASTTLSFDVSGFGTDNTALIGFSLGNVGLDTGDGRRFGLGPGVSPFGEPGFNALMLNGAGSTAQLPNLIFPPGGTPVGLTVYVAAAGFGPTGLGNLTDVGVLQF